MRKPTVKQFAKAHPELVNKQVKIHKEQYGCTVWVNITEDLTFDEKGRVLTQLSQNWIIGEDLSLKRQYGKNTDILHKYGQKDNTICFMIGSDEPETHNHTEA